MLEFDGLFPDCIRDPFVAMSHADRGDAAKEIEVLLPIRTYHSAALGMVDNDRLFIVVGHARKEILLVLFNNLLLFHSAPSIPIQL